ncbi:hypothetical protein [Stenotrophomonas maltophilia]|uniref:hypothetical protein n=1 Tax=Stenotrophomonas maltophilia TaxID=40324 RepID=UPI0039C2E91C
MDHTALNSASHRAQATWENREDPRIAAEAAVDSTALEALRAAPTMLEQTFGFQPPAFWAKAARLLDSCQDAAFAALIRDARDAYVNEEVQDVADDKGLSANGAIDHLLAERAA